MDENTTNTPAQDDDEKLLKVLKVIDEKIYTSLRHDRTDALGGVRIEIPRETAEVIHAQYRRLRDTRNSIVEDYPRVVPCGVVDPERDYPIYAIVRTDYSGSWVITVDVSGHAIMELYPEGDEWMWLTPDADHAAGLLTGDFRQTVVTLLYHLGEVTEERYQQLADEWGGPREAELFELATGDLASEGHGVLRFIERIQYAVKEACADVFS
jgi:hypothetical protein